MPFGWMALICFAFWLGYDLYSQQGRLRKLIQHFRSIGQFGDIANQSVYHDLGQDHGGHQQFIRVVISFRFQQSVRVDVIRLTSNIYRLFGTDIEVPPWSSYTWRIARGERHHKGDIRQIEIAHIPYDPAYPGVYGDLDTAGYYLTAGSAHVVIVEIFAGKKAQSEEILILMPHNRIFAMPDKGPGQVDPGARFIALKKGESLFPKEVP